MPVFLVRVTPSTDMKDGLKPITDAPTQVASRTPGWADLVPELGPEPSDFVITKRHWGAFYGTELDLQLRRRGIDTIVLCGISTNIGVESTARFAYEYGYQQIFVEDAMTSGRSKEDHDSTVKNVFPRMGRVRKTEDILTELA
jgi:nicotinamidase-related amidase